MVHLAYYFSTFPALTTTFAQHQVRATGKLGLKFILAANRCPGPHDYHPQDDDLRQRTFYLAPVQPWAYLWANLQAWRRWPGRYPRTLALALRLQDHSPWQVLKNLVHLVGAAVLGKHLLARQVPHVHVHFAYGAAEVALFLEALCGLPYSLSIHGSDVLMENPLIEEKRRRARGLAGRQRALELFDLNRNARKLMAVFAQELPGMQRCQEVAAV